MQGQTVGSLEKRYITYQILRNVWLVGAIWLIYFRLFITDQQVGILDAVSFGIGLLAEIPSGAMADNFGRKKMIILGLICAGAGNALQGLANGYTALLIGQTLLTAGWAFCSGADTALFYESLGYAEGSSHWRKLVVRGGRAALMVTLLAEVVGAYLFRLSPRLPFIALGVVSFSAIAVIVGIHEAKIIKVKHTVAEYISGLKDGIKQLGHRNVIGYVPIIIVVQGLFYTYGYGLLRPMLLTRFNFSATAGSWVLFACGLLTFFITKLQQKYVDRVPEKAAFATITLAAVIALLAAVFPVGHAGLVLVAVLFAGEYLIEPWISDGLNKHVSSRHRATALSTASFLKALPYVLLAPVIGALNVRGKLQYFLVGQALLCVIALVVYVLLERTKQTIS